MPTSPSFTARKHNNKPSEIVNYSTNALCERTPIYALTCSGAVLCMQVQHIQYILAVQDPGRVDRSWGGALSRASVRLKVHLRNFSTVTVTREPARVQFEMHRSILGPGRFQVLDPHVNALYFYLVHNWRAGFFLLPMKRPTRVLYAQVTCCRCGSIPCAHHEG